MRLNKVGEFAFDASKQKRQGIPLKRVKESVFGKETKAKPGESKKEGSPFLT